MVGALFLSSRVVGGISCLFLKGVGDRVMNANVTARRPLNCIQRNAADSKTEHRSVLPVTLLCTHNNITHLLALFPFAGP